MKKLKFFILSMVIFIPCIAFVNIHLASVSNKKIFNLEILKNIAKADEELYIKEIVPCSSSGPTYYYRYPCSYVKYFVCYEQVCTVGGPNICFDMECGYS